jgi:hypothetical protein
MTIESRIVPAKELDGKKSDVRGLLDKLNQRECQHVTILSGKIKEGKYSECEVDVLSMYISGIVDEANGDILDFLKREKLLSGRKSRYKEIIQNLFEYYRVKHPCLGEFSDMVNFLQKRGNKFHIP